jgi:dihydropteroate synthase
MAETASPAIPASRRARVMGIVNVTPDSFSDGGDHLAAGTAITHALQLAEEGADILDIGGESTRPGHQPVGAEEEWRRVGPVLAGLADAVAVPLSIDTTRAATADRALAAGARIVNDVWGFQADPDIARVTAAHGAEAVLMHNRREIDPELDIIADMKAFFARSLDLADAAGLPRERIVLDPGIGFGKTLEQNLHCIRRLPELKELGFRVLVGASRKSFLQRILPHLAVPKDRGDATLAAHAAAVLAGADIIRVHDVRPHVEMVAVLDAIDRSF